MSNAERPLDRDADVFAMSTIRAAATYARSNAEL
jgi:hypothetical protein